MKGELPKVALSIRQPWAWLILHGGKDIENRCWPTRFRGFVLIHASKGMTRGEYAAAQEYALARGITKLPAAADLERGGVVGVVRIVDCVARSDSEWFGGPYGFVLEDAEPLPFQAGRGALGFFPWEADLR